MKRPARILYAAIACVLATAALPVLSQKFPIRPISLVTEFSAGAGGDVALRVVASRMSELMGQPMIVEARPGAGGVLAGQYVARAPSDGHTLLASTPNMQVIGVVTGGNPDYEPRRELTPVAPIATSATFILVRPDSKMRSLDDLIAFARRNPGKLSVGHSGFGTTFHLMGEEIKQLTGITWTDVPYKGGLPATQAVAGGQIDASLAIVGSAMTMVRSGKVNVLAVLAPARLAGWPDTATVSETVPAFKGVSNWTGIFAPAGLAQPVRARLNSDFTKAVNSSECARRWRRLTSHP
jgi:tripartite-type tricarboxylate transporter receptor subunit TctC